MHTYGCPQKQASRHCISNERFITPTVRMYDANLSVYLYFLIIENILAPQTANIIEIPSRTIITKRANSFVYIF